MEKMKTKNQQYRWLAVGALGPTIPTYFEFDDIPETATHVGVRYNRPARGRSFCIPYMSRASVVRELRAYELLGFDPERFVYHTFPPMHGQLINAELGCVDGFATLHYSLDPKRPMRPSLLASGRHCRGPRVWLLLRQLLPAETVSMLREMYDSWCDDHVIEFTGYDHPVTDGGSHVIVWEVRAY